MAVVTVLVMRASELETDAVAAEEAVEGEEGAEGEGAEGEGAEGAGGTPEAAGESGGDASS